LFGQHRRTRHLNRDARILIAQPAEDGGDKPRDDRLVSRNPDFAGARIGEKFDGLDALPKAVEDGRPTFNQSATKLGRLDTFCTALEQRDTECAFKISDRS
jgi:hypothetical protein